MARLKLMGEHAPLTHLSKRFGLMLQALWRLAKGQIIVLVDLTAKQNCVN